MEIRYIAKTMDGKTELKYTKILFVIYFCLFLALKLLHYFQFANKQQDNDLDVAQEQLVSHLDSQLRIGASLFTKDGTFNKIDSANNWLNEHLDSIYPGLKDSIEYVDYRHMQLQHLDTKLKRQEYTLDCLEFKQNYLDSHFRILGLSQFDSTKKLRDSLAKIIIHEKQDEIVSAKMSIRLGEMLLKFIYLPLILFFPGRWLLNYFRNR